MITQFLPSKNGFHFANSFHDGPVIDIQVPLVGKIGVGNASGGLCGGMAFAAFDHYLLGMTIPSTADVPEQDSPLFQYIAGRLIDSFDLPFGVMQYLTWMIHGGDFGDRQLAEVCKLLGRGGPATLGLVLRHSLNPADLAHCHQVLAYQTRPTADNGYRIGIYDPNYPDRDDIFLLTQGGPHATEQVEHSEDGPIRGFFLTKYSMKKPPETF